MRAFSVFMATTLLSAQLARAQPAVTCAEAAASAERSWHLPPGLLGAVGRIESGRFDPKTGQLVAWPWSVGAAGAGHVFASLAEAVTAVPTLQARGAVFVDVGCFQVDLFYHPDAFSSLERAFDPIANADYAARLLSGLRARTGNWDAAVAGYHAQGPAGEDYRRKVMAQWLGAGLTDRDANDLSPRLAEPARPPRTADPFVIAMSAAARAIPVFRPGSPTATALRPGGAP